MITWLRRLGFHNSRKDEEAEADCTHLDTDIGFRRLRKLGTGEKQAILTWIQK